MRLWRQASEMRAYVHIGNPKCASTSLQNLLASMPRSVQYLGKGRVRKVEGAEPPPGPMPHGAGGFVEQRLGWVVRREIPLVPELSFDGDLVAATLGSAVERARAAGADAVRLSDEVLSGMALSLYGLHRVSVADVARRLANGFGVPVTFLIVVRSQPEFLWSYYRQLLRRGYPLTFAGFVDDLCVLPTHDEDGVRSAQGLLSHLDYARVRDAVGEHGDVVVVPFEQIVAGQTGVDAALAALGLPGGRPLPHANTGVEDPDEQLRRNRGARSGIARRVASGLLARDADRPLDTPWRESITPQMTEYFAAANQRFAGSTGLDLAGLGYPMP